MARKRYRRYYKRKGRWSSNITNFSFNRTIASNDSFSIAVPLTENTPQIVSGVSQKYTVKNVNLQFMLEGGVNASDNTQNNSIENLQLYVLFIPQGYIVTGDTPFQHPEWIMAYRFVGIPVEQNRPGYSSLSIRSSLARKLDTGDGITLLLLGSNASTINTPLKGNGILRFNTKAN